MLNTAMKKTIISREFARRVNLNERLTRLREHGGEGIPSTLREQHVKTISHPYLTVGLERYHRVAAICGVEPRHPLLDRRVVEFLVSIPWGQKVRSGWNKYLLRKVSENTLSQEVCWRQGWEHLGWTFESKWLAVNLDEVTAVVDKMLTSCKKYMNVPYLYDSINHYEISGGYDYELNILDAYHLTLWSDRNN